MRRTILFVVMALVVGAVGGAYANKSMLTELRLPRHDYESLKEFSHLYPHRCMRYNDLYVTKEGKMFTMLEEFPCRVSDPLPQRKE